MSATQCSRASAGRVSLPRSPRSAPEQNASPAPVMTRTRSDVEASTSRNTASSSLNIAAFIAFFLSGRLRVKVTTPFGALSTSSVSMGLLLSRDSCGVSSGWSDEKGPAARRRPTSARDAYSLYVERAAEGATVADGPFSSLLAELHLRAHGHGAFGGHRPELATPAIRARPAP